MRVISQEQWQRFLNIAERDGAVVTRMGMSAACLDIGSAYTVTVGFTQASGLHLSHGVNHVTFEQGHNLFKALQRWEEAALRG